MRSLLIILTLLVFRSDSVIVSVFPSSPRFSYDQEKSARRAENVTGEVATQEKGAVETVLFDAPSSDLEKFSCSFPSEESGGRLVVSTCDFKFSGPGELPDVQPWLLGVGKNAYWLGGPTHDNNGSTSGGYAFVDTSRRLGLGTLGESKAWLPTTVYPPTGPEGRCLKFAVTATGTAIHTLRVYMVQLYPLDPQMRRIYRSAYQLPSTRQEEELLKLPSIWNIFNHTSNWREISFPLHVVDTMVEMPWTQRNLTYSSAYPHGFIFEAEMDSKPGSRGYLALDDVSFEAGSCKAECEFNSDFCNWTHGDGDFRWSIGRGSTKPQTGPLGDQGSATGNPTGGGYAYIDSSSPRRSGHVARLVSPELTEIYGSGPVCLSFWLNMYGDGVGQLRLVKEGNTMPKRTLQRSRNNEENVLWKLNQSGPQNLWYRAQVTLSSPTPFKVIFEATIGEPDASDIAVDTVRIEEGPCSILPQNAAVPQSGSLDCTFLDNTCAWQLRASQVSRIYGNFKPSFAIADPLWTKAGVIPFDGNPPGRAVALSGSPNPYMLFRTFPTLPYAPSFRGFLVSPQLQKTNESMCLSFWTMLSTPTNVKFGGLEVLLCPDVPSRLDFCKSLWRLNNHQKSYWFYSQVAFTPMTNQSVLVISGIQGNGARGTIGVDDVVIFSGACSTEPQSANVTLGDCHFDNALCSWTIDDLEIPANGSTIPAVSTTRTLETISSIPSTLATSPTTVSVTPPPSIIPAIVTSTVNVSAATEPPSTSSSNPSTPLQPEATTTTYSATTTISPTTTAALTPDTTTSSQSVSSLITTIVTEAPVTATTSSSTTTSVATSSLDVTTTSLPTTPSSETSGTSGDVGGVAGVEEEASVANFRDLKGHRNHERRKGRIMNKWKLSNSALPDAQGRQSAPAFQHQSKFPEERPRWRVNSSPFGEAPRPGPTQGRGSSSTLVFQSTFQGTPNRLRWSRPLEDNQRPSEQSSINLVSPGLLRFGSNPSMSYFSFYPFQEGNDYLALCNETLTDNPLPAIPPVKEAQDVSSLSKFLIGGFQWRQKGWQLAHPQEVNLGLRDRTFGILNGGFTYFWGSDGTKLIAPRNALGNSSVCIQFYFSPIGPGQKRLEVKRLTEGGDVEVLWSINSETSLSHKRGSLWSFSQTWVASGTKALFFEGSGEAGGFALDDIALRESSEVDCNVMPIEAAIS